MRKEPENKNSCHYLIQKRDAEEEILYQERVSINTNESCPRDSQIENIVITKSPKLI